MARRRHHVLEYALAAIGISLAIHGLVAALAIFFPADDDDERQATSIEVREREKPEPPPPPPPPPPAPPPEVEKLAVAEPRQEAPKPDPKQPEPPPEAKKPVRVVGLSMDSTTAGGDGPGFAVGNTSRGETERVARDPNEVPKGPPPAPPPATPNKQASRIPGTATGGKMVMPKRKKPAKLPYPETLKSQGIEADVTVIVNVDAEGKVTSVKIARSSGYPEFDEVAERAARAEEFEPASRDGAAIPYTLSFTYRFRLEDQ